ncbi:hypothetical protein BJ742DRAFT_767842 [Cladochytrium replicatum]|nr:hypothetical protein BJ742DRAFT_767842 [Cladochytrium replicatum]
MSLISREADSNVSNLAAKFSITACVSAVTRILHSSRRSDVHALSSIIRSADADGVRFAVARWTTDPGYALNKVLESFALAGRKVQAGDVSRERDCLYARNKRSSKNKAGETRLPCTLFEKASSKLETIRERTSGAKKEDENEKVRGKDMVKDSQKRSPIVEFAVEDVRKLKVREQKSRVLGREARERLGKQTKEKSQKRKLLMKNPQRNNGNQRASLKVVEGRARGPANPTMYLRKLQNHKRSATPHETDSKRKRQKTRHLSEDFGEAFDFPEPTSAPKKKTPKQTKEAKEEDV